MRPIVPQRRSLDAGYGTDPHPSNVGQPCGRAGLRERRPSALARQKVRMPRSSRGCSFVRCFGVKGRPGPYAEGTMAGSRSSPKKMDTRPRPCSPRAHPRRERFGAGGADSSLIGDFRGASRASAAITRSAGLRFCALGDCLRDPLDGHGPDFRQLDWRASATVIRYGLTSAYGQSSTGQRPRIVPFSSSGQFWEGGGSNDVTCNSGDHRPSIPARSRAGMLLACGSASAGTAPYAISSCQSRHMMTAKRKAANTS